MIDEIEIALKEVDATYSVGADYAQMVNLPKTVMVHTCYLCHTPLVFLVIICVGNAVIYTEDFIRLEVGTLTSIAARIRNNPLCHA